MTETVSTALEKREKSPGALVKAYSNDFATVLPSHIKPDTWVRLAQGALRKGKKWRDPSTGKDTQRTELEVAATNNPGVFLAALLDAARLGLEPGTEQYYLTPRKVKGHLEILGIPGYQGYIELMYRAGAISSVVAEVVHIRDHFQYRPGRDDVPDHEIDWDADDRGPLRLAYAYARMKDGATSRVVVLNKTDIARIKKSSQGSDSEYSPWNTHTEAMWLKSAVRQLAKWVPTSAEYIREQLRAVADVQAERTTTPTMSEVLSRMDPDDDVIDGEIIDGEPPTDEERPAAEPMATGVQLKRLHTLLTTCGITNPDERRTIAGRIAGHPLESTKDLTSAEIQGVHDFLANITKGDEPALALDAYLASLDQTEQA